MDKDIVATWMAEGNQHWMKFAINTKCMMIHVIQYRQLSAVVMLLLLTFSQNNSWALTITDVSISGPQKLIQNGPHATYTLSVEGTGAGTRLGTRIWWSIYELDEYFDDLLIDDTGQYLTDNEDGSWSFQAHFDLWCEGTSGCRITGKDGSDGDNSPPEGLIFAHFEDIDGINYTYPNFYWPITCVPVPVPLPAPIFLFGSCIVGFILIKRRVEKL